LEDIDGISLVYQNHQWFFTFEEPFFCDWIEYAKIMQSLRMTTDQKEYNALMEQLVGIVRNGIFLANVHNSEIDNYKSTEEEKLEQLLKEYIQSLYNDKQYHKVILTAPAFFAIEPLNETILSICIKSYEKLGKKGDAKAFFKNYKRIHELLTGKEYRGKKY
jgi:DNA-binding SARP family transcriptional activator